MTAARKRSKKRIPEFESLEQEAEFWDSHSPLEFSEFRTEKGADEDLGLNHILAVRFDAETIARLGRLGRAKGIGPSTLARMWVLERLAGEGADAQARQTGKSAKNSRVRRTSAL